MVELKDSQAKMKMIGILLGVSISCILFLLGLLVVAGLVNFFNITSVTANKMMFIVNYGVVFMGGVVAAYTSKSKGWLNGGLVGLIYISILIIGGSFVTSLVFSGDLLLQVVIVFIVSILGGIIGINMI